MKPNRLCSICARGGSKGVKNKNLRDFSGIPLIAHIINIVQTTKLFDALAVSSDSHEILKVAQDCGVDYLIERPLDLATDEAAKLPAIQHCVTQVQKLSGKRFQTNVDISVTAPLILPEDISGAVKLLEESDAINVISGTQASHSPYFSLVEKQSNNFYSLMKKLETPFVRRQDCPPCYGLNGAIYVWKTSHFFILDKVITEKTLIYEMPQERSIDIDTEFDLEMAQYLYQRRKLLSSQRNDIATTI